MCLQGKNEKLFPNYPPYSLLPIGLLTICALEQLYQHAKPLINMLNKGTAWMSQKGEN